MCYILLGYTEHLMENNNFFHHAQALNDPMINSQSPLETHLSRSPHKHVFTGLNGLNSSDVLTLRYFHKILKWS